MRKTAEHPAGTGQITWSVVVDAALIGVAVVLLTVVSARYSAGLAILVSTFALLVLLAGWWWMRSGLGTSIGHALFGLRTISRVTGMPGLPFGGPRLTVNIRAGLDPLVLVPAPIELAPATRHAQRFASPDLELHFDDGSRHVVRGVVLVGRAPQVEERGQRAVALPDFTRSVAPTHVRLEPNFDGVLVTDLGSAGGTWSLAEREPLRLLAQSTVTVPFGAVLALGSRRVTLKRPIAASGGAS